MAKSTPSMAKNLMSRSLRAIVDPYPSTDEVDLLWKHFRSRCAYCGARVQREARNGHVDHLIASSSSGRNSIYNRVLSCARCNGDEKRELDWETFLKCKAKSQAHFDSRWTRIEHWKRLGESSGVLDAETATKVESIVQGALASFEDALRRMRELRSEIQRSV